MFRYAFLLALVSCQENFAVNGPDPIAPAEVFTNPEFVRRKASAEFEKVPAALEKVIALATPAIVFCPWLLPVWGLFWGLTNHRSSGRKYKKTREICEEPKKAPVVWKVLLALSTPVVILSPMLLPVWGAALALTDWQAGSKDELAVCESMQKIKYPKWKKRLALSVVSLALFPLVLPMTMLGLMSFENTVFQSSFIYGIFSLS